MTEWSDIVAAVQTALGGEQSRGGTLLDACWAGTTPDEHAKRCVLAHYLADLQGTLDEEIRWDEAALAEYQFVGETDLVSIGIESAAGLAPSLHLNLGDGYLRRGDLVGARSELAAGLASVGVLGDDGYGALVRSGLSGLAERIEQRGG